jgi:hypothetical protein
MAWPPDAGAELTERLVESLAQDVSPEIFSRNTCLALLPTRSVGLYIGLNLARRFNAGIVKTKRTLVALATNDSTVATRR